MSYFEKFRTHYFRFHGALALLFALMIPTVLLAPRLPHRCPFQLLFRIYCPGCGGTRALEALLCGDVLRSFLLNPPLWLLLTLLVFGEVSSLTVLLSRNTSLLKARPYRIVRNALLLLFALGTVLHFLVRNVLLFYGFDPLGDLLLFPHLFRL